MAELLRPHNWNELAIFNADDPSEAILSLDHDTVLAAYKEYGALLFRSFRVGIDNFRAIVRLYSNAQVSYPGSRRLAISHDGKVQTVDAGTGAIPLHSELSHTPFRPDRKSVV